MVNAALMKEERCKRRKLNFATVLGRQSDALESDDEELLDVFSENFLFDKTWHFRFKRS